MSDWAPSHDELVMRAVKWLRSPCNAVLPGEDRYTRSACGVVVPELVSYARETPDAIGWHHDGSTLVECKVSRADFLADRKKRSRIRGRGAGSHRFFLCPLGVIETKDLQETDWGLLYCLPKKIRVMRRPAIFDARDPYDEIRMLYSLLRRAEVRGLLGRCLAPKWGGDGIDHQEMAREVLINERNDQKEQR